VFLFAISATLPFATGGLPLADSSLFVGPWRCRRRFRRRDSDDVGAHLSTGADGFATFATGSNTN
jgi:hypothetical protein